jgi:hypothetical protein
MSDSASAIASTRNVRGPMTGGAGLEDDASGLRKGIVATG